MADDAGHESMVSGSNGIVRTGRGLTITGTRVTLYDVMDYVRAGWSADRIAGVLALPREQIDSALCYIGAHESEVEAEYESILRQARENRAYWEERNRERTERIRRDPPPPEKAALVARLRKQIGLVGP